MKHILFTIGLGLLLTFAKAQNVEFGPQIGAAYYIGDLNPQIHFGRFTYSAYGAMVRYNFNTRTAFRLQYLGTQIAGHDGYSTNAVQRNRGLHFSSKIREIGLIYEINFTNYSVSEKAYPFSPFIFAGLAYFNMNPQTVYRGDLVDLQSYGTEGQFQERTSNPPYKLNQMCIPFGIGIKARPMKWVSFNVEWGLRKTFTDYMDDVSNVYTDPANLDRIGQTVADRSNIQEGINGNNTGVARGNPETNDWYGALMFSVAIQLGGYGIKCKAIYN